MINTNACPIVIYNNVGFGIVNNVNIESSNFNYNQSGDLVDVESKIMVESQIPSDFGFDNVVGMTEAEAKAAVPSTIYANGNTDNYLEIMKARLKEPKKSFHLFNSGYGSFQIWGQDDHPITKADVETYASTTLASTDEFNVESNNLRDLNFGPKPRVLSWEPQVGRKICRVVFELIVVTKECFQWDAQSSIGALGRIKNFEYSQNYKFSQLGRCTRTVEGIVEIHNNTTTVAPIATHSLVDAVRDTNTLNFPTPSNFKRTNDEYKVNQNSSKLTFTIEDKEVDSNEPYPPGVNSITMDHEIESEGPAFVKWENLISGSITLYPDQPYFLAYIYFASIVRARLFSAFYIQKEYAGKNSAGDPIFVQREMVPIPTRIRVKESMYRGMQRFGFSFGYTFVLSEPSQVFSTSGLFTSIADNTGHTWDNWKNSIQNREQSHRGISNYHDITQKLSIGSCSSSSTINNFENEVQSYQGFSEATTIDSGQLNAPSRTVGEGFSLYDNLDINSGNSIIDYELLTKVMSSGNTHTYERSEAPTKTRTETPDAEFETYYDGTVNGDESSQNQNVPKQVTGPAEDFRKEELGTNTRTIQRGRPSGYLLVTGSSRRFGGPTPAPRLTHYGGAAIELVEDEVATVKEIDSNLTNSVHYTEWAQIYVIKGTPINSSLSGEGMVYFPSA